MWGNGGRRCVWCVYVNGSVNCRVVMGPGRGAGASAAKRVGIEA